MVVERKTFEKNTPSRLSHHIKAAFGQDTFNGAAKRPDIMNRHDVPVFTLIDHRPNTSPVVCDDGDTNGKRLHNDCRLSFRPEIGWK